MPYKIPDDLLEKLLGHSHVEATKTKYILVAQNAIQAKEFVKVNHLKRSEVIYVSHHRRILGINHVTVIFLRGWSNHPDAIEICKSIALVYGKRYGVKQLEMEPGGLLPEETPS